MFSLGTAHLFSRSGMLKFLAAKHILSGMTFLSLVLFWCFGEPESSLPLKLGDWGAAPSQGRSDTNDGFLIYGVTSRMNLTINKSQRRRSVFLLPMKNNNWNTHGAPEAVVPDTSVTSLPVTVRLSHSTPATLAPVHVLSSQVGFCSLLPHFLQKAGSWKFEERKKV